MGIKKANLWVIVAIAVLVILVSVGIGAFTWYKSQLEPVNMSSEEKVRFSVVAGMSGADIAEKLEADGLIKSATAMNLYLRLNGQASGFQVGVYTVSANQSLTQIVAHLTSGQSDEMSATFYPGAMLERADKNSDNAKYDVYTALKSLGFDDAEIEEAFLADYRSPVFADRPDWAGLEGYIYGDTYFVRTNFTAKQVLQVAIDEFARVVKVNDLERKFASRGLTLYEGITLASIVERESIGCPGQTVCEDQRLIASVFYNRLDAGMTLGSDVTYHYAADVEGLARDHRLDSDYNTRIVTGLPPGPIAVPGLSSLNAVADPASTEYLFFLSGDDDKTYFGKTDAEHNANIRNHCKEKCLLP